MGISRVLLTPGEPAGIGPDIVLHLIQKKWPVELIVFTDPEVFTERAKLLNLPITLMEADFNKPSTAHSPGVLKYFPISLASSVKPGHLNVKNADYVLQCLHEATRFCLEKKSAALVTGPVHKGILNQAGFKFSGHTEFLGAQCQVKDTVMLFIVDALKVALITTHLPLSQVPSHITAEKIKTIVRLLHRTLSSQFAISSPRISICALNPHAGENGYLGKEEITIIKPALEELAKENISVQGPFPADTIFTEAHRNNTDVIVGMYHDQVLPVVKYLGFDRAVNITLGLPFIRTSVDHGTALDKAGTGAANPGSLISALEWAIKLGCPGTKIER